MVNVQGQGQLWRGGRLKRASVWVVAVAALLFLATLLFDHLIRGLPLLPGQIAYLPILLAAAMLGLRGGTVVGLLVGLVMAPVLLLGPREGVGGDLWWVKVGLYALFGVLVGMVFQWVNAWLGRLETQAERLSEVYTQTLSSLAHTVEVRDRHTTGHSERVAKNAVALGRELGFMGRHLEVLYWSAMLHDLGKIAIADYILLKDGPLSQTEYDEVKRHPEYGAELLASLSTQYAPLAQVVRSHHERWDGRGYPQGLAGPDIPVMSRIISIVDVFEALTSERPYRQPMPPEEALEFVAEAAGTQFDPNLVDVFVACYRQGEMLAAGEALRRAEPLAARGLLVQASA